MTAPCGLTVKQLDVIKTLWNNTNVSIVDICEMASHHNSKVTPQMVKRVAITLNLGKRFKPLMQSKIKPNKFGMKS